MVYEIGDSSRGDYDSWDDSFHTALETEEVTGGYGVHDASRDVDWMESQKGCSPTDGSGIGPEMIRVHTDYAPQELKIEIKLSIQMPNASRSAAARPSGGVDKCLRTANGDGGSLKWE